MSMLFHIFRDVSTKFETVQWHYPLYFPLPFSSSFASGDLRGNLLSFYCAVKNLKPKDVIRNLNLEDSFEKKIENYRNNYRSLDWLPANLENKFSQFYEKYMLL